MAIILVIKLTNTGTHGKEQSENEQEQKTGYVYKITKIFLDLDQKLRQTPFFCDVA